MNLRIPLTNRLTPLQVYCVASGLALFFLVGCDIYSSSDNPDEQFFPLKIGQQWKYRITESEIDMSRIRFPREFTVSVIDEVIVTDKKYFRIVDYFVPGPSLPDTLLIRRSEMQIYIRFSPESEELLFYTFAPTDTTWTVPMFVNPSTLYSYAARMESISKNTASVTWELSVGRSESGWKETFQGGLGRAEIVSVSQAFGKIVWTLVSTY